MKLKLKNFRCYVDTEFDFGETGLTLLSGGSGTGKSTVMTAIEFALFGTGTNLKTLPSAKSCSVELEVSSDFKIFRQKTPNRLIVNDIYEDEAGESFIRERFGGSMLTCYIPQNIRKTFILMSPAERLDFLESLVSSGTDIHEIKATAKSLIKTLGDEHKESIGALKSAEHALKTMPEPQRPRSYSKKFSVEEQQTIISKLTKRISAYTTTIEKTMRANELLKRELNAIDILDVVVAEKTSRMSEIDEQIGNETTECDEYKGDGYLSTLKESLRSAIAFVELQSQHASNLTVIDDLVLAERQSISKKMEELKSTLWVDFSKSDALEQLSLWKDEVKQNTTKAMYVAELNKITVVDIDNKRVDELTVMLSDLKRTIELAEHPLFTCPSCQTDLRFTGNSLVQENCAVKNVDVKTLKERLKAATTELQKLNADISVNNNNTKRREQLRKEIEAIGYVDETAEKWLNEISEYIARNKADEEQYMLLEASMNTTPKSVQLLLKKNEELVGKMKKEKEGDVTFLKKNIQEQETLKSMYDGVFLKKKKLQEQRSRIQSEIDSARTKHIATWGRLEEKPTITTTITTNDKILEDTGKSKADDIKKLEMYKISLEYCKQYELWKKLVDQRDLLTSKEDNLRKRYASACTFKEKILEAESIAITSMITTINTHAQAYLEHFFPDNTISVRLVAFKETKESSKPQINVEVDYKGIEHDLTMLSGGELSRVILAFTLALAEIHHTPFVLLDESTSSLDQELTSSVIEGLKENFNHRLVVVIAHQVIQGVFDKVVTTR